MWLKIKLYTTIVHIEIHRNVINGLEYNAEDVFLVGDPFDEYALDELNINV
jgi:hypothetical protein